MRPGRITQVCSAPAKTPTLRLVIMPTGSGRSVVVPSPSWPALLAPQHLTVPDCSTAQVCARPAATRVTPLARPVTSTGTALNAPADGAPSWPRLLSPQHLTPPDDVTMQV